jgi:hypothetical protein
MVAKTTEFGSSSSYAPCGSGLVSANLISFPMRYSEKKKKRDADQRTCQKFAKVVRVEASEP